MQGQRSEINVLEFVRRSVAIENKAKYWNNVQCFDTADTTGERTESQARYFGQSHATLWHLNGCCRHRCVTVIHLLRLCTRATGASTAAAVGRRFGRQLSFTDIYHAIPCMHAA